MHIHHGVHHGHLHWLLLDSVLVHLLLHILVVVHELLLVSLNGLLLHVDHLLGVHLLLLEGHRLSVLAGLLELRHASGEAGGAWHLRLSHGRHLRGMLLVGHLWNLGLSGGDLRLLLHCFRLGGSRRCRVW